MVQRATDVKGVTVPFEALDLMMPMQLVIGGDGCIRHAGPTLQKLITSKQLKGAGFFESFEVLRPRSAKTAADLMAPGGARLKLRLRGCADLRLKGIAVALPNGQGVMANLSFGISVPEAIRSYALDSADFAHTDLVIEMLYLIEAKEALTAESQRLSARLLDAKGAAEVRAQTDTLTGLKNRRAMDDILLHYAETGRPFSLATLDLDHFKAVNDTLGHAAGDAVLRQVAQILTEETREADSLIRLGGDEFMLIFDNLTDPDVLRRVSGRILKRLAVPIPYEDKLCQIAGSAGITISTDYERIDPQQMQIDADVALYAAKKGGRAQARFVNDVGGVGQTPAVLVAAPPIDRAS